MRRLGSGCTVARCSASCESDSSASRDPAANCRSDCARLRWQNELMNKSVMCSLLLMACGTKSQTSGVAVMFGAAAQAGAETVTLPSGRTLKLSAAHLTVHSLELQQCPSAAQRLGDWLLPSAWAHSGATATHLEGPFTFDLLASDRVAWGRINPAAGEYCGLEISVSAMAPARHEDAEMASLHIAAVDAADTTQAYDLDMTQEVVVTTAARVSLSSKISAAKVDLSVSLAKLLAGVDEATEAERPAKLAANLSDAVSVAVATAIP